MRIVLMLLLVGFAGAVQAQHDAHADHALGNVDFPVSCSAQAQVQFNHAVALLHHMTYPQAREAFRQVAATDPGCAMAQWGIAMTLFQPLWPTRPRPAELQQGWDAVQKAQALQPPTQRERLFVAAAQAFFLEPASSDYWLRIRRWEQASAEAYAAFPGRSRGGRVLRAGTAGHGSLRQDFARALRPGCRNPAAHLPAQSGPSGRHALSCPCQ